MPSPADSSPILMKAAAYCRVSTRRQAKNELSLAEQESAIAEYAVKNGYEIVQTYVESGVSGTTDRRPELQRLIRDTNAKPSPFSIVLVYNTSRFFRNANEAAAYRLKLAKRNVRVISVTQDFGDGPEGELALQLVSAIDQYSSSINGSQVRLVMTANAEAGFWNGSRPPFGYRAEVAEQVGQREKKRLAIDPDEAQLVRRIFNMYLNGENGAGPQGLKAIASRLNSAGVKIRGKRFITSTVADLLRREAYIGVQFYNVKDSRTGEIRPREEWIPVPVPPIIEQHVFDAVQERLQANKPTQTPARRVNSPTLLAQVGRCAECGAALLLMTGKGGRYRYITCQTKRTMSADACSLRNFRLADVDDVVVSALEQKILQPDRLRTLLAGLLEKSDQAVTERRQRLARLRTALTEAKGALGRLWDAVEAGVACPRDAAFKERLDTRNREIRSIEQETRQIECHDRESSKSPITDEVLERFGGMMRSALRDSDPHLRRGYLQMLVSEVRLSNERLVIRGPKNQLETIIATVSKADGNLVPTFAGNWRARNDSNVRPSDS